MVALNDAFRQWFGKSVVRRSNGQPKVMYHGTRRSGRGSMGFDIFRTERIDIEDPHSSELGAHFGTLAQAEDRLRRLDRATGVRGAHRIYPVYLSIQNPIRMDDPGEIGGWSSNHILDQLVKSRKITREAYLSHFTRDRDGRLGVFNKKYAKPSYGVMWLESLGYDGIVYKNRIEGNKKEDSYIILHPSQVKSAIGNRGTWDANDPNILHGYADPYAFWSHR